MQATILSIFEVITTIEDIMFTLTHAKRIFPESPLDIEPHLIKDNLQKLKTKMAKARADAIALVQKNLRVVYPARPSTA